ncbi:MAG: hypothetical protein HYV08_15070, partial [Deltaproteobacteria bacterium]|nr:hypothetical protein [Deltaproteobacteria bacterium]
PAGYLRVVRTLETPDDHTVVFRLKRPHAPFLAELRFFFPVSPAAVARHEVRGDRAQGWLNDHSAGTGPYQVQRWDRGRTLAWTRNPHYWRGWRPGQFETVNLHMIYDTNTQRLMLEKGDLDVAQNISIDDLPAVTRHPDIQVQQHTGTSRSFIFLNGVVGPTRERRVRQAIAHAWNADAYNALRRGQAPQSDGPCPLPLLGPEYTLKFPYAHDPAKARALLAQAGYPSGGFSLRFLVQKGDEQKKMQFEVLQGELAKLNVRLELIEETWPAINKRLAVWGGTRDAASAVHMVGFWRGASTGHIADFLYWSFHTDASIAKGGRNLLYYSNPEVDRLVNQAMATSDEAKARPLWRKANELILEDSPALFVEKILDHIVMRKDVQGYLYRDSKLTYDYYRMTRAR